MPLEECASKFNIDGGSNERTELAASPRSMTRYSAAKKDGTYDVAIIGSGCIGAAGALLRDHTTPPLWSPNICSGCVPLPEIL